MLVVTVGGMLYSSKHHERLAELKTQYENKNLQFQLFLKRSPAPTKANLEALDKNYNQLFEEFRTARKSLNLDTYDQELFFGQPPVSHNDAFFSIAKYVEDARNLAISTGVRTPEDCRYGLSEYENEGPSGDAIERVHKQTKIMEALLQTLFDSGISELVSIKREASILSDKEGAGARVSTAGDVFSLSRGRFASESNTFDSLAFQLEFVGQSLSLRNFLNRVSNSSLPFSINEIEVRLNRESGSGEERTAILENPFLDGGGSEGEISALRVPIISENESQFVITLEFLEMSDEANVSLSDDTEKGGGNV